MHQSDRSIGRPSFFALGVIALAGLWLTACSTTTQGSPRLMVDAVTAPPVGAFAFCIENAVQCGLESPSTPAEGEPESLAQDLAHQDNYSVKNNAKEESSNSVRSEPVVRHEPELAHVESELTDAQLLAMARVINASINTLITYRSDDEIWNAQERWILPIQSAGINYGDCEDYALEKRAALLAAGAPADRLAMATAWSEWTGQHAVLILRLEAGDYVLDNTTPHILNVAETSYQWQALQTGPSLLEWSSVTDAIAPALGYTAG